MEFNEYQRGTEFTNVYGEAIDSRLFPIEIFIHDHYEDDEAGATKALAAVSELRQILNVAYAALGLSNEAGEVAGKLKKVIRGDRPYEEFRQESLGETGDVLYYLAQVAARTNYTLEHVAKSNHAKLQDRMQRGVIKGNGDNR